VANKALSSDKNGGAGTQTNTKEPWLMAQPWINQNMAQGQALQSQLAAQPFSPQQQAAYNNSYAQSDYMRGLVPSLLGQMSQQQVGFDRNNPQQTGQKAWDWAGLMGAGSPNLNQQSVGDAQARADAAAAAAAAAKKAQAGDFTQFNAQPNTLANYYGAWLSPNSSRMLTDGGEGVRSLFMGALGDSGGGFGEFKYGQATPAKGTQAFRDMQEYFSYGGNDPYNIYGRAEA
jgi:hypothetical protein